MDGEQAYVVAGVWDEFGGQLVAKVVDGRAAQTAGGGVQGGEAVVEVLVAATRGSRRRPSSAAPPHRLLRALRLAFDADCEAVLPAVARRNRLDAPIAAMAAHGEFTQTVTRMACLRGISTLIGFALAVEVGDWHRFTRATIGANLELLPSEYSLGPSLCRGRSPRPETPMHADCWWRPRGTTAPATASPEPSPGPLEGAAPAVVARANAGNQRLHARWQAFTARKKRPVIANVAVARELAGWCRSLATLTP